MQEDHFAVMTSLEPQSRSLCRVLLVLSTPPAAPLPEATFHDATAQATDDMAPHGDNLNGTHAIAAEALGDI